MAIRDEAAVDLTVKAISQKASVMYVSKPHRLARLHQRKYVESLQGYGLKGFQYLLARLVHTNLGNMRKFPLLDMKCRGWELWVYPDGKITIKVIRPLPGLRRPLCIEYDLGYAKVDGD